MVRFITTVVVVAVLCVVGAQAAADYVVPPANLDRTTHRNPRHLTHPLTIEVALTPLCVRIHTGVPSRSVRSVGALALGVAVQRWRSVQPDERGAVRERVSDAQHQRGGCGLRQRLVDWIQQLRR